MDLDFGPIFHVNVCYLASSQWASQQDFFKKLLQYSLREKRTQAREQPKQRIHTPEQSSPEHREGVALLGACSSPTGSRSQMLVVKPQAYQEAFFKELFQDTLSFAGAVIIRRILGIAHVIDFESIEDLEDR